MQGRENSGPETPISCSKSQFSIGNQVVSEVAQQKCQPQFAPGIGIRARGHPEGNAKGTGAAVRAATSPAGIKEKPTTQGSVHSIPKGRRKIHGSVKEDHRRSFQLLRPSRRLGISLPIWTSGRSLPGRPVAIRLALKMPGILGWRRNVTGGGLQ